MSDALMGRAIAGVGVVLGFAAIFTADESFGGFSRKYSDDGTVLAFLLITLILTAMLLAAGFGGRSDLDAAAAVAGSAVFGFYLLIPAAHGFDAFGSVGTGGWLGVCTGLIPLGLASSMMSRQTTVTRPGIEAAAPAILGRILCVVAIWLTALDGGPSYWNLSSSGHALGLLMLLVAIVGVLLGFATTFVATSAATAHGALIVGAISFGLYEALLIGNAFGDFGRLGTAAWLGSVGALVLLLGAARLWQAATGGSPAARPTPAMAPPAA